MTHDAESWFKAQLLNLAKQRLASLPGTLEVDVSPAAGAVGPELPAAVAGEDEELEGEQLEQQLRALFEIPPDQPIVIIP